MNTSLCVGQNCGARSRRTAVSGLRLCTACYHELKGNLIELPEIYDDCESALLPGHNPVLQQVSGTRRTTGILLDEGVITVRSKILGVLASWSALVADERTITKPARHPAGLAVFLIKHLNWLLAHPAAANFAEEISLITTQARSAVHGQSALRIDLGQCIHPGCDTSMTTTPPTGGSERTCEVRCAAGHTWQPHQWLQLSRQIQQNENVS
jgi:hypothetical protein